MMQQTLPHGFENGSPLGSPTYPSLANIAVILVGVLALVVVVATFVDARVATAMAELPPAWVGWARRISDLGLSGYMFAIAGATLAACWLMRRFWGTSRLDLALTLLIERSTYILAVLAISGILAQVLKHLVGRARPKLMPTFGPFHFDLFSLKASLASFPSGHAATAFSVAMAVGWMLPLWRTPLVLLAVLIGLSRIILGAHYVSDVVAGAALGLASTFFVTHFFADWGMAFEHRGQAIRLKGAGVVAEAFSGWSAR
jgi:membrane-associated phospholipid phosphatase